MPPISSPRQAAPRSLFRSGIGPRLALAVTLSVVVWLAIAWALAA
ncbi:MULTISPECIES: hypothetical protein [unclassified Methylobacterium]|nr:MULTISPECIES: hypothetical protein [unclassified Methylobacterium]